VALVLRAAGFPPNGQDVPVHIKISCNGESWVWVRDFGGHETRSNLRFDYRSGCVREQFGTLAVWLRPELHDTGLHIGIKRLTVLGLPVPQRLLPRSTTREWQDEEGRFRFDVAASAPGLGLLIRYQGWLTPDHGDAEGG